MLSVGKRFFKSFTASATETFALRRASKASTARLRTIQTFHSSLGLPPSDRIEGWRSFGVMPSPNSPKARPNSNAFRCLHFGNSKSRINSANALSIRMY